MQNQRRIMLFSPPLPPVPVESDQPVVIGRQAQCELPLCHSDVSRQHAEVSFEDGQYWLRDLGSTNGTFLNGKEISTPSALSPGDKIEMGSRVVTFCELSAQDLAEATPTDSAQTIIAERMPQAETFAGDLSQIPPFAVLQVLEMGTKSGILEIESTLGTTRLWLDQGIPVHAESERQSGFDAALGIVSLEQGRFRFDPQLITVQPTLACTVTELLMEGCRLMDEEGK